MSNSILPSLFLTLSYPTLLLLTYLPMGYSQALTDPAPERIAGSSMVQEVAARLIGTMDTAAQSVTNPNVANIRMTTCPITLENTPSNSGALFLYQEQAAASKLAQPYRQRFLRLSPSFNRQVVESQAFKPTNLSTWINFCNQPVTNRVIRAADLGNRVCTVFLKQSGQDYVGRTPVDGCPANYRGAVRITNRIVLRPEGMDTWDRGFDQSGKQVWGAKAESYQFRRSEL